jgi:hypothetical protein
MCSLERHLMQCLLVATNVKSMLVIYGKYRIPRSSYSLGALSGRRCDQALHYKVPRNNSTTTISIIQAGSKIIFVRNEPHNPRVLILSHWAPGLNNVFPFYESKVKRGGLEENKIWGSKLEVKNTERMNFYPRVPLTHPTQELDPL